MAYETNKNAFKLSYNVPVYVSDIAIRTILDEAFIVNKAFEAIHLHSHPYYEIHICLDGEYKISFLDDSEIHMKPNTICLIPPKMKHCTTKDAENTQNLAVRFTYSLAKGKSTFESLYPLVHQRLSEIRTAVQYESGKIVTIAKELRQETLHRQFAYSVLEKLLLSQIYTWLFRVLMPEGAGQKNTQNITENADVRFLRIDRYMQDHYCEDITQEDVAAFLNLSKRQVSREFQKIYGLTFHEKLTDLRLLKAIELLTKTDVPIEKIALTVGYASYAGFSAAFRKKHGMSAKQYRAKHKQ